jgi:fused signal recognition particle receptor
MNELLDMLRKEMAHLLVGDDIESALTNHKAFSIDAVEKEDGPAVSLVVGVNGVGKTTSIGKLAHRYKSEGKKVVLGAADTFRAAAVEQLILWGEMVGVSVISQGMGADPAAVAYDTLESAKSHGADVVIIDTAGRLHNKVGLMNELTKIKRVMDNIIPGAPHEVWLVLDGSTGQNALIQAQQFSVATQLTGLVVTKLDGTAKGGAVIAVCDQVKVPVRYIGVGEKMENLQDFNPLEFIDSLLPESFEAS